MPRSVDRHARADEQPPVQREVGDRVGAGEAPAVEVRVDDLEAVRDPLDAADQLALRPCRARGARAKPNMTSGSRRGCTSPRSETSLLGAVDCVTVVFQTGPQIGA